MKTICAIAAVGLSLMGSIASVSAQPYGGRDDSYRDRGSRSYEDRDGDDRGRGDRVGNYDFDEREYLRCNPDVSQAVERGTMPSGSVHYQNFGRKEGRRLSC
jgi:hypothetical protein